jgi:hypothetical protein
MILEDTDFMDLGLCVDGTQLATGAVAGILEGAKAHLTSAATATGRTAVLADLLAAECKYTGYAPGALTWAASGNISDDGFVEMIGHAPQFRPTDAVKPESAYNLFITDTAGANLLLSGDFDAPINLRDVEHQLTITVRWRPLGPTVVDVVA